MRVAGRPSSCSSEGQYAPQGPNTRTNDENTGSSGSHWGPMKLATPSVTTKRGFVGPGPLQQARHRSESTRYENRSNAESTDLQNFGEKGKLCRPRNPVSTQRGDVPTRAANWSLGSPMLLFNELTVDRIVGLQDCSGEVCSLSEYKQLRRQTSCAFCHRTRTRSGEPATLPPAVRPFLFALSACLCLVTSKLTEMKRRGLILSAQAKTDGQRACTVVSQGRLSINLTL